MLTKDWRGNMHAYLCGIINNLNGVPLAIDGIEDHVHLLVGLRPTHRISDIMRELKSGSSDWASNTAGRNFNWQPGYFALTVSPSQIERVRRYILNQEQHHEKQTYQEEYVEMLELSGIEYEERYLW
jgi:REP element-mobilizing transposase RayT